MADSTFRAGGLVSGIDTNSIVDQLVKLQSRPVDVLRKKEAAFQTKISTLGDLASKLKALNNATTALGDDGALGVKVTSDNTDFTAETSATSLPGRTDIAVTGLASAARALSVSFGAADSVRGGTLTLTIDGTPYATAIGDGDSLATVASSINNSGAPVTAIVLNDGTNDYLSIVNRETGYPIGGPAGNGLQVSEVYTGGLGKPLALAVTNANNATLTVNGLPITRRSNSISDVVTGTTLNLLDDTGVTESLLQENDATATATNLQTFVDAYNELMAIIQKNLTATATTDRNSSLVGDAAVRRLSSELRAVLTTEVGVGNVRTLVDLGIKSARDGSISLDTSTLAAALENDASAVNSIFSTTTTGISDVVDALEDVNNNVLDGSLEIRKDGLNDSIDDLEDQAARLEARIEKYKERLIAQFSLMEQIISKMKASGDYLSQQLSALNGNSK